MALTAGIIFSIASLICHQRPERSFFWAGHQFPVCARCTGLYVSAAFGVLAWVSLRMWPHWRRQSVDPRTARTLLIVAALPTALSLATGALGVWDGSNVTRAVLALPLGGIGGAVVAAVVTKNLR
jgi:uncharacterized membrane protein